jgi:hypothetical protein
MAYNLDDQFRLCIESQNEEAKNQRATLTHVIQVVCVFGKLGLAFSGQEKSKLHQQRKYLEVLKLLENDVVGLKAHVNDTDLV